MIAEKINIYGLTVGQLKNLVLSEGWPGYISSQLADWLYKKQVNSFDKMTNLPKNVRGILNDKYEIQLYEPSSVQVSADGTKKYLYASTVGHFVETAYIPEKERATLCVSTQVGCKMGCLFCMTGKQGFQGNLSSGEILNQIQSLPEFEKLTNIVYMGMGEPLDNLQAVLDSIEIMTSPDGYGWSSKRITVSTVGLIPAMKTFLEKSHAHLAVSLHTPFDAERRELMPVQNVYPIKEVIGEIKRWDLGRQRRVSFEYIMFEGFNDTALHVNELAKLLNGLRCRINLIRFHPIPDTPLKGTQYGKMVEFRDRLNAKGITATIRASRGEDILAACGLLSTKELVDKKKITDF